MNEIGNGSDEACAEYIKGMHKTHEAFKNFGIDLDYGTTKKFNAEILVRYIVKQERFIQQKMFEISGLPVDENLDEISEAERFYAGCKIMTLIDLGIINKVSLELIKKEAVI